MSDALKPIQTRILEAYRRDRNYSAMLRAVFPEEHFPNAHRISSKGGPPGCAMAFGRALREMGGCRDRYRNIVWIASETPLEPSRGPFWRMPEHGPGEPPQIHR